MKNIWFLRLDKSYIKNDSGKEIETLNIEKPYIYTFHGSCANETNTIKISNEYKMILECIKIQDRDNLIKNLIKIKKDFNIPDKEKCIQAIEDFAIDISIGDIVFVRVAVAVIYICKIISDIQILDFNCYILPSRNVEILSKLSVEEFCRLFVFGKTRVDNRKTIERVANKEQKKPRKRSPWPHLL